MARPLRVEFADALYHDTRDRERHLGRPSSSDLFDNVRPQDKSRRNRAIAAAYLEHVYTMKSIADYFDLHCMTVSRAANAYEEEL